MLSPARVGRIQYPWLGRGGATASLAGMEGGAAQGVGHDSVPLARIGGLQHPWMG